jgi:hypothetical protein
MGLKGKQIPKGSGLAIPGLEDTAIFRFFNILNYMAQKFNFIIGGRNVKFYYSFVSTI